MIVVKRPWTSQPQNWIAPSQQAPLANRLVLSINGATGVTGPYGQVTPTYVGTAARGASGINTLGFISDDTGNDAVYFSLPATHPLYAITTQFTLSIWIRYSATTSYSNFLSVPYRASGWTPPYNSISIYQNPVSSNKLVLLWANSTTQTQLAEFSSIDMDDYTNRYINITITRNGSSCSAYINGSFIQSATASGNSNVDWGEKRAVTLLNANYVGLPNSGFTGINDQVDIWARDLNSGEVAQYFKNRWSLYAPRKIIIPTATAAAAVPSITAVYADSVGPDRATPRVTLNYA